MTLQKKRLKRMFRKNNKNNKRKQHLGILFFGLPKELKRQHKIKKLKCTQKDKQKKNN